MLILTSKEEETIFIGENISIKIVQIRGNLVRLGIDAPADILVLRGEEKPHEQIKTVEPET